MNSLSWTLYLADALGGLQTFFGAGGMFTLVGGVFLNGMVICEAEKVYKSLLLIPIVGVLMLLTSALLPSKNTVLLIAASQAGEKVMQTDDAKEVYGLLREQIKRSLKEVSK